MRTPTPGSKEAIAQGCTCPILDNSYGKGYLGNPERFVIADNCRLHSAKLEFSRLGLVDQQRTEESK